MRRILSIFWNGGEVHFLLKSSFDMSYAELNYFATEHVLKKNYRNCLKWDISNVSVNEWSDFKDHLEILDMDIVKNERHIVNNPILE